MRWSRILAAAAAGMLLAASRADAQRADSSTMSTALWTSCPGARVRIALRAGETLDGACGPVTDERLQVRLGAEDREVLLAEVDSVWTRRSYLTEATVLLAIVGATAGAFVSGGMDRCDDVPGPCTVEYRPGRAGGAAIGAVTGAVAGVLVGPRITAWRLRFP